MSILRLLYLELFLKCCQSSLRGTQFWAELWKNVSDYAFFKNPGPILNLRVTFLCLFSACRSLLNKKADGVKVRHHSAEDVHSFSLVLFLFSSLSLYPSISPPQVLPYFFVQLCLPKFWELILSFFVVVLVFRKCSKGTLSLCMQWITSNRACARLNCIVPQAEPIMFFVLSSASLRPPKSLVSKKERNLAVDSLGQWVLFSLVSCRVLSCLRLSVAQPDHPETTAKYWKEGRAGVSTFVSDG